SRQDIQSKKYNMDKLAKTYHRKNGLSGTVLSNEEVSNAGFDYYIAKSDYQELDLPLYFQTPVIT
ncbi:hypothetical protein, partial [Escherichia coli]